MKRLLAALQTWRDDFDAIDPFQGPDGLHYRGSLVMADPIEHAEHTHAVVEAFDDLDSLTIELLSHTLDLHTED